MKSLLFCFIAITAVSAVAASDSREKKSVFRGVYKDSNVTSTPGFPDTITSYQVSGGLLYPFRESDESKPIGYINTQYTVVKIQDGVTVFLVESVLVFPGKGKLVLAGDDATSINTNDVALVGGTGMYKYARGEGFVTFLDSKDYKFSSVVEIKLEVAYILR